MDAGFVVVEGERLAVAVAVVGEALVGDKGAAVFLSLDGG